jgi:hypothetical protein
MSARKVCKGVLPSLYSSVPCHICIHSERPAILTLIPSAPALMVDWIAMLDGTAIVNSCFELLGDTDSATILASSSGFADFDDIDLYVFTSQLFKLLANICRPLHPPLPMMIPGREVCMVTVMRLRVRSMIMRAIPPFCNTCVQGRCGFFHLPLPYHRVVISTKPIGFPSSDDS